MSDREAAMVDRVNNYRPVLSGASVKSVVRTLWVRGKIPPVTSW
ncbi:hypothetical protein [Kineosporia corallincola]|nr:hypothetical protein [Kineosporia corallincola]